MPTKKQPDKRSLNTAERAKATERFGKVGCSIMVDKNGYFATTQRARTESYPTLDKLPKNKVKFVDSTC